MECRKGAGGAITQLPITDHYARAEEIAPEYAPAAGDEEEYVYADTTAPQDDAGSVVGAFEC